MSVTVGTRRFLGSALLLLTVVSTASTLVYCVGEDPQIPTTSTTDSGGASDQQASSSGDTGGGSSDASTDGDAGAVVVAPSDPVSVSAGFAHACVVLARGDVFCWGRNGFGETGETPGGTGTTLQPRVVSWTGSGSAAYAQVVTAWDHTCAGDVSGSVYCWGRNDKGQLGNNALDAGTPTPQAVLNDQSTFLKVHAARGSLMAQKAFSCGVKPNGEVACWGAHEAALDAMDPGGTKQSPRALNVVGIAPGPLSVIAGGVIHSCAAAGPVSTAPVVCWGGNELSQMGNGTAQEAVAVTSSLWPAGVAAPTQISGGVGHTCSLVGGSVYCWGFNGSGCSAQPSGGQTDLLSVPTKAAGLEAAAKTITRVAAGGLNTCVVRSGEVLCVGANESGQLGIASVDGTAIAHSSPQSPAQGIDDAVDVAVGGLPLFGTVTGGLPNSGGFACAIRQDKTTARRTVWCWGANDKGQLGTGSAGTPITVPVKVNGLPTQ